MASTSDIRKGLCIRFTNDIYKIIEFLHVTPGKGPAFVRTKLKSVTTGKVLDNTFSAGHKLEDVRVETRSFQFLYSEGSTYHFMNTEDYDQITLEEEALEAHDLLKEGEVVTILFNTEDSAPLSVDMPASVVLEVTHSEPGVKGNTATNATIPATVETGARINVPLFINEGDKLFPKIGIAFLLIAIASNAPSHKIIGVFQLIRFSKNITSFDVWGFLYLKYAPS